MMRRPGGPLGSSSGPLAKSLLFPLLSPGLAWRHKAYLGPVILTVLFVVAAFAAQGNAMAFNLLLASYLSGAGYYVIYLLCGKRKPWWLLPATALLTMVLLVSPVWTVLAFLCRAVLPGLGPGEAPASFAARFVGMFFGAGLPEELIKAVPVAGAAWLGSRLASPWRERMGVGEPLDGIVVGAASAVGFTLLETLGDYVPGRTAAIAQRYGEGTGYWLGLQLLIPRVVGALTGHMAYSGYLGYFIGLAVLKPAQRWQILGIGYLTAAGLHALWNAAGVWGPAALVAAGSLSYVFLAAAILKARQLSPTRAQNFATHVLNTPPPVASARFALHVGGRAIALHLGTQVREQDIPGTKAQHGDGVVAEVVAHPQDPTVWGLKNLSQQVWSATSAQGSPRQVDVGRSIRLEVRTKIHFGRVEGDIY